MYEDGYDLTDAEKTQVQEVLAEMSLRGGRLTDSAGRPIAYRVLRGRRFVVCDKGMVWRYAPAGAPHIPGVASAAVRRNSVVEMWTGRWRKATTPDGKDDYAKCLVWIPLDDHINGHPGISKLGWYRSEKGFKHPLDLPQAPTAEDLAALAARRETAAGIVAARMHAEGLNVTGPTAAARPAGRSRRNAS